MQDPLVFYCGSLQGLDRSETGPRGFSLLDIHYKASSFIIDRHFVPSSPLEWRWSSWDLSSVQEQDFEKELLSFFPALHLKSVEKEPVAIGCRVVLTGKTSFYSKIEEKIAVLQGEVILSQKNSKGEEVYYWIVDVRNQAVPDVDLHALSKREDPVGLLASYLL